MKPYYEIAKKSEIVLPLTEFAFRPTEWTPYYNFSAKRVPPEIIFEDPFFIWLSHNYSFVAGILKLDPYTCYDWHKDTRRGVGINMLLTPHQRSFCVFRQDNRSNEAVFKTEELSYKPMTYYLFNTQIDHTVYNFETTRYLLSIDFAKDKTELDFDQLVKKVMAEYE